MIRRVQAHHIQPPRPNGQARRFRVAAMAGKDTLQPLLEEVAVGRLGEEAM